MEFEDASEVLGDAPGMIPSSLCLRLFRLSLRAFTSLSSSAIRASLATRIFSLGLIPEPDALGWATMVDMMQTSRRHVYSLEPVSAHSKETRAHLKALNRSNPAPFQIWRAQSVPF